MSSPTKAGSLLGGILLIAGSCIGAGMLALPVVTGVGGFVPSIAIFLFTWLFMSTTGLLLLEANLTLGYDLSLISLAQKTLGSVGKAGCWLLFLFLASRDVWTFYCFRTGCRYLQVHQTRRTLDPSYPWMLFLLWLLFYF